jgi:8-amino-7-oxononanoate synthase
VSLVDILNRELASIDERGLRRRLRSLDSPQAAEILLEGRSVINFSSNNYLGLADHAELREAAQRALAVEGVGAGAARLIVGNLPSHRHLERQLASFHGAEASLLFPSGYQANVGVLAALAGPEDAVFSDELNHASLIDGCRLSRARVVVYPHADPDGLDRALVTNPGRRRFIVTDTVFSMDGDLAPLVLLRKVADKHGAFLIVDEAHATGVIGPLGRGLAAELGVPVDVHLATLGKALGVAGAYVTGPRALIDFLLHRARSFVFTTGTPPMVAAAAARAVELAASTEGQSRRAALRTLLTSFAKQLLARRLLAPHAGASPIFPIHSGDERRVLAATELLLERGLYVQAIRPPTVPRGTSRLRVTIIATHTEGHIQALVDGLHEAAERDLVAIR